MVTCKYPNIAKYRETPVWPHFKIFLICYSVEEYNVDPFMRRNYFKLLIFICAVLQNSTGGEQDAVRCSNGEIQ